MTTTNLNDYICFNFYTGWRKIQMFYKSALGNNISAQQSYVLELLDEEELFPMSKISKEMQLDKAPVSSLISRMEKSGLVLRYYHPSDRRSINVGLTEEGLRVRDDIREKMISLDKKLFKRLSSGDVDALKRIVEKIDRI